MLGIVINTFGYLLVTYFCQYILARGFDFSGLIDQIIFFLIVCLTLGEQTFERIISGHEFWNITKSVSYE